MAVLLKLVRRFLDYVKENKYNLNIKIPSVNTLNIMKRFHFWGLKFGNLFLHKLKKWLLWTVLRKQLRNGNQLNALIGSANLTYTMLVSYLNYVLKPKSKFHLNLHFIVFQFLMFLFFVFMIMWVGCWVGCWWGN